MVWAINSKAKQLKELNAKVEQLQEQLSATRDTNRNLIANISHEIRTPLSAIISMTDNLLEGVVPYSEHYAQKVLQYSEKLNDLTNYLLGLSKLEAGNMTLQMQPTNIGDWIEECVESMQMLDAGKDLQFIIEVEPENLQVELDQKLNERILVNLVQNAIKYATPQSEVRIGARLATLQNKKNEQLLEIFVHNQGQMIKQDKSDQIFERFYTESVDSSQKMGGTGIGLSIAKWAVDLQRGHISSRNPNDFGLPNGALFVVEIPVSE